MRVCWSVSLSSAVGISADHRDSDRADTTAERAILPSLPAGIFADPQPDRTGISDSVRRTPNFVRPPDGSGCIIAPAPLLPIRLLPICLSLQPMTAFCVGMTPFCYGDSSGGSSGPSTGQWIARSRSCCEQSLLPKIGRPGRRPTGSAPPGSHLQRGRGLAIVGPAAIRNRSLTLWHADRSTESRRSPRQSARSLRRTGLRRAGPFERTPTTSSRSVWGDVQHVSVRARRRPTDDRQWR